MPERILLIGAGGQLGLELLRALAALGSITATRRTPIEDEGSYAQVDWRTLDVTDTAGLRQVVREVRPTLIVNASGYTAVDQAETEPELAQAVNGLAPGVLAEEGERIGAGLVHYSTDYVFDGTGTRPWSEEDPPNPLSAYGRSKLAGELAVQAASGSHLIIRSSWIYAQRGRNFVKTMLKLASTRPELRVVDDRIGAPTSADVVATITAQILAQGTGSAADVLRERGGLLHVCCAGDTSWHGFTTEIVRLARASGWPVATQHVVPIKSDEYQAAAQRPPNSRLDCSRLAERFGQHAPDWRAALAADFPQILARLAIEK